MKRLQKHVRTVCRFTTILASYCLIAYLIHGAGHDLTHTLLGGGDGYTFGFPSKLFANTLSPWDPYFQLGTYAFANTQAQPFYPPALFALRLFPNSFGYDIFVLGHYALAGLCFFFFARNLRLNEYAAYFGGVCFMCSGFLLMHKGHEAMLSACTWLPFMLLFIDRYVESGHLREAALGGVGLALCILSGFPQVTLYASVVVVSYFGYRCLAGGGTLAPKARRLAAGLAAFCLIGLLLSSPQLVAVAESLPHISRQKITMEMFNQDSLALHDLGLIVVPNMSGGLFDVPCFKASGCGTSVYFYPGLIPLILAAAAVLWLWRTRSEVIFWAATISIAAILALGWSPVQQVLYRVPVYNLFRAPSRHLFEVNFGISVLVAYGTDALFTNVSAEQAKRALKGATWVIAAVLAGVLCFVQLQRYVLNHLSLPAFAVFGEYRPAGTYAVKDIAASIALAFDLRRPTSLYPIVCFVASAVILWLVFKHPRVTAWRLAAVLVFLSDVSIPYHKMYENPDTRALDEAAAPPDINFIRSHGFDETRYRVYPVDYQTELTFPLLNIFRRIPVVNDYGPMWFQRYQAVTGFFSNGFSETAMFSPTLLDALSVKFLVVHDQRIAHQLRWISRRAPASESLLPVPALNCAALTCVNVRFSESGVISFAPSADISIIQVPFEAEPNTVYEVSFEGRSPAESVGAFYIYLYRDWPEWEGFGAGQLRSIRSFGPEYTKTSVLIDSGHMSAKPTGKQAFIRLYTASPGPYEIRNLTVAKLGHVPAAYKEVFGASNGNIVFENPGALPRFRFASQLIPVRNVAEARGIVLSASFDPVSQVTVEGLSEPMTVGVGTVLSQHLENNSMTWQVEIGSKAFFVVADSWFPGWIARIDGHTEPIQIVDGFLRGVFVTGGGRHLIQMEFHPRAILYGSMGAMAGLALVIGFIISPAIRSARDKREDPEIGLA